MSKSSEKITELESELAQCRRMYDDVVENWKDEIVAREESDIKRKKMGEDIKKFCKLCNSKGKPVLCSKNCPLKEHNTL